MIPISSGMGLHDIRQYLSTYHFVFSFESSMCKFPLVFCELGVDSFWLPGLYNS
uniref:Uncharacterized protein n=1 Tax=Arundo donax TaxID=35708 RepID=A0A0A9FNQ6_ARUDO